MLFNIYYLNFSKVYEIKMMLSNIISTDISVETEQAKTAESEIKSKIGAGILNLFNSDVDAGKSSGSTDSQKVLESFKVSVTKSLILNEVIEKCDIVSSFSDNITEGQLVRIDNVTLSLENEAELRTVKMFSNGSFKGMILPEAGGIDINNLFNSMFKDYSYKIKGRIAESSDQIVIKIPVSFENEFENQYSVDDLFLGNVSVIGIYKGKTQINSLRNSFDYFQELGQSSNNEQDIEIHNSQHTPHVNARLISEDDGVFYNYIDLLAIVQVVKPKNDSLN